MDTTQILRSVFTPVALGILPLIPMIVVGLKLQRQRRLYRAAAHEPFTQLPIRPPGESLRLKIEQLSEEFDASLFTITAIGAGCLVITVTAPKQHQVWIGLAMLATALCATLWTGRKMSALAKRLWEHRLGFTGERVVGEELNQLLASGFRVFHDVPFAGFNIDHIIVGTPGVYVIETKSRRKPSDIKGAERATIIFDGTALVFPKGYTDTKALEQTRRNARTVEAWLTQACGEPVDAKPVLTFPGWFITRKAASDVNVLNPDEIKRSFPARPRSPLSPDQIQRIAYQLTERCRLTRPE